MAGLDPAISFTPTVTKAFGSDSCVVVKHAVGGTSIRAWCKKNLEDPPPTVGSIPKVWGCHYDRLREIMQTAIKENTFQTVTFVWMQGESDKRNPQYHAYLPELVRQVKEDLGRADINVVIGRISDAGLYPEKEPEGKRKQMYDGAKYIRRTQVAFAESYPRGAWVDTDDLNDRKKNGKIIHDVHYTVRGYEILGQRFAEAAIDLIKKRSSHD
jgi:hypothetical protein